METRLNEVRHLYPNAEWWIKRFDDNGAYYGAGVPQPNNSSIDERKIVMRPLSDIKEDEANELVKLRIGKHIIHNLKIKEIYPSGVEYSFQLGGKSHVNKRFVEFDELSPAQFTYLLSKSFDLFGLIESGEALDKTKLPSITV